MSEHLELLADARAQLADSERAMLLLVGAVGYLTRRREDVPHNVDAERRVLGAYLLGRLSPGPFVELELLAFDESHRELALPLLALAELEVVPPLAMRDVIRRIPVHGPRRRAAIVRLIARLDVTIPDDLPWPASISHEYEEVRARARRRAALRGAR